MNPARTPATLLRGLCALVLLLAFACDHAFAQGELQASQTRVEAAFLFKFGGYVEWPAEAFATATTPLTIGVIDADPLADELASVVAGRDIGGRPVRVRKLQKGERGDGIHVLFIGRSAREDLARLIADIANHATLIVTHTEGALALGSTINFVMVDGKLRFDVALPPARAGHLRISSRLLAVARRVQESPP